MKFLHERYPNLNTNTPNIGYAMNDITSNLTNNELSKLITLRLALRNSEVEET